VRLNFFGELNLTVDIIQIVKKYVDGCGIQEGGETVINVSAEKFWAVGKWCKVESSVDNVIHDNICH